MENDQDMTGEPFHFFLEATGIRFEHGVLFENNGGINPEFEHSYLELRNQEGRVYPDEVVRHLPATPDDHPLRKEWMVRQHSSASLIKYLKHAKPKSVLEVGCGNGWLINAISRSLSGRCIGMDINVTELKQAARVFSDAATVQFVCADIYSNSIRQENIDVIVLAGVTQYFPALSSLIKRLKNLLEAGGEIHILDSPFYAAAATDDARKRSSDYFNQLHRSEMAKYYFHHSWDSLKDEAYEILYDPSSLSNRIKRMVQATSPFPWIVVRK